MKDIIAHLKTLRANIDATSLSGRPKATSSATLFAARQRTTGFWLASWSAH
ncbi:hypothetical protein [Bradyrhizobium sp. Gha]|uniref:hypothetical protein n=1 Tax=Bradyrhizobium sp. Gha TaxID=1855318 RepID=UPI0015A63640|nr:hypothetical protein [Bradyrhizobium sp. Gha]